VGAVEEYCNEPLRRVKADKELAPCGRHLRGTCDPPAADGTERGRLVAEQRHLQCTRRHAVSGHGALHRHGGVWAECELCVRARGTASPWGVWALGTGALIAMGVWAECAPCVSGD
jgi:hypothetical protein